MEDPRTTYQPEHASGAPRRGSLRRQEERAPAPRLRPDDQRLIDTMQRVIDDRLEDGMAALETAAADLMREVAGELWRASGADVRSEQERIVSLLSRDQSIRGLIATSDERFQALSVKYGRLEDQLAELVEYGRATRESMDASVAALHAITSSPTLHGVEEVRGQLEQVENHIARTFQHLDDRDRALTEAILGQVVEHGDLIARETTRIVEAMQGYVQGGTESIGRLAQRVEEHAQAFASQDVQIAEGVRASVAAETEPIQQQLELLSEKVGLHGRAADDVRVALERLIEARMRGLAELIRSDSTALRTLIQEREAAAPTFDEQAIAETLQVRLTSMELMLQQELTNAIDRRVAELERSLEERMAANAGAIEGVDVMLAESQAVAEERVMAHIDDRMTAIARLIRSDNQVLADRLLNRPEPVTPAPGVEPELLRETLRTMKELQAGIAGEMVGSFETRIRAVSDQLHQETQSTAEAMVKVAEVLGGKIDRLSVRVDEGYGNELQVVIDRMTDAIRAMSMAGRQPRYDVG